MTDKILDIISKHTIGVPRAKTLEDLADLENNTVKELETLFSLKEAYHKAELEKKKLLEKISLLKACRDYDASGKNRPDGYLVADYHTAKRIDEMNN